MIIETQYKIFENNMEKIFGIIINIKDLKVEKT